MRFFLKNTMGLNANLVSRSKFWCHFCEQEIREDRSVFACVTVQNVETVKSFWFENGGDVLKRQSFCISEADLGKWEEACKAVPHQVEPDLIRTKMNNILSERYLADATSVEHVNQSSVVCASALAVKPLSVLTDQSSPDYCHANGKIELAAAISGQPWIVDPLKKPQFELEAHRDGMILVQDMHAYTDQVQSQCQKTAAPSEPKLLSGSKGSVPSQPKTQSCEQLWTGRLDSHQSTAGVSLSIGQTESATGQDLTAIRRLSQDPGEGNVHSGALPPWLKPKTGHGLQASVSHSASRSLPLSRKQQRKLAKLRNPNRVGAAWAEQRRAEMERELSGDVVEKSLPNSSAWLPSFGRVWQSGSCRETRKEFEIENRSERRKRSSGQSRRLSDVTLDTSNLRPYVSKRQRTMDLWSNKEVRSNLLTYQ